MRLTLPTIVLAATACHAEPLPMWPVTFIAVDPSETTILNDQVLWDISRNGAPIVESSFHLSLNQFILQDDPVLHLPFGTYAVSAYGPAQDMQGEAVFEVSQQATTVTVIVTPRNAD